MLIYDSTDFFRLISRHTTQEDGTEQTSVVLDPLIMSEKRSSHPACLVPFKMLSTQKFAFPFSAHSRVRDAVKLQTLSFSSGEGIQIFPSFVEKSAKSSSGFSCFISDVELSELENSGAVPDKAVVIPAPFVLISAVNGKGLTIWTDNENICSVLWNDGIPEVYRWKPASHTTVESEITWFENYIKAANPEDESELQTYVVRDGEYGELPGIINNSLKNYQWLADLNISRNAINSAMIMERAVRIGAKAAMWIAIAGLFLAGGGFIESRTMQNALRDVRGRSERLYRDVFDKEGRLVDPVSQARGKINLLRGNAETGRALVDVLADISEAWNVSMDVSLDSMRYNSDGADVVGAAKDMGTIQNLRVALVETGMTVQLGDVQQIPGGGFRFNLGLKW